MRFLLTVNMMNFYHIVLRQPVGGTDVGETFRFSGGIDSECRLMAGIKCVILREEFADG